DQSDLSAQDDDRDAHDTQHTNPAARTDGEGDEGGQTAHDQRHVADAGPIEQCGIHAKETTKALGSRLGHNLSTARGPQAHSSGSASTGSYPGISPRGTDSAESGSVVTLSSAGIPVSRSGLRISPSCSRSTSPCSTTRSAMDSFLASASLASLATK